MAPAPASRLGTVAHWTQTEGGGLGLLGHGSPTGWWGVHTGDQAGGLLGSVAAGQVWARCLCWGPRASRHATRASERGPSLRRACVHPCHLLSTRTCCARGRGPGAVSAPHSVHVAPPLPAAPALPGASTPHLPWCGAEDEAPGRGQLGCRATLPHAHPHPRLCPASASDHAPGSGAAPGKAARGSLSPRQEPG